MLEKYLHDVEEKDGEEKVCPPPSMPTPALMLMLILV